MIESNLDEIKIFILASNDVSIIKMQLIDYIIKKTYICGAFSNKAERTYILS